MYLTYTYQGQPYWLGLLKLGLSFTLKPFVKRELLYFRLNKMKPPKIFKQILNLLYYIFFPLPTMPPAPQKIQNDVRKTQLYLFDSDFQPLSTGFLLFLPREDDAVILLLEPLDGIFLCEAMCCPNPSLLVPPVRHVEARSTKHHVEVKTIDPNAGVVLDAQINVLLDAKSKVASVAKVVFSQLVFTNFQTLVEDLLSFGPTHGAVDSDLLISPDPKGTHCVSCLGEHGCLAC